VRGACSLPGALLLFAAPARGAADEASASGPLISGERVGQVLESQSRYGTILGTASQAVPSPS